ncbi:MAG: UDP-N-acetylmuramoyl-tripeptide--D-alanyl-D-alanine ligase [Lentimicrobiaceae bacterium]|nr:UDP-N-acetylmuramoyl-tripeptide--D-alanyl-D-alanine ligase [Lentimicrobiaceae bacterium]
MIDIECIYKIFTRHPAIVTDSRKIIPGCIFFALKGENFNGNIFAQSALDAGAAYAVVDDAGYATNDRCLLTDNVLQTLQQLATFHRMQFEIPVIAITGTNGKTTSKELISNVLKQKYALIATAGNLNNHIGVPLTLLSISKKTEIAVVEMGANHPGEIEFLCHLAKPTYGLITNIGKAHLEGFGSFDGVIATKTELYRFLCQNNGKAFVNSDNLLLMQNLNGVQTIEYGKNSLSSYSVKTIENNPFVKIMVNTGEKNYNISTHLIGNYNSENIQAAIAVGTYFGVSFSAIKNTIENYRPSNNRSQMLQTAKNTLVLDMYNANPTSMSAAIDNFSTLQFARKMLILGDMLELGTESEKEHQTIIKEIENKGLIKVILIGSQFCKVNTNTSFHCFADVAQAKKFIQQQNIENTCLLIKGSRGIHLEDITDVL